MKRRLFTILSALSLLLFLTVALMWVVGHAHAIQVSIVSNDGTERTVRVMRGMLVVGTLPWRPAPRAGSPRSPVRDRVLGWPEHASAVGLPAQLGFYRDRRTFSPDHVFYGAGLSDASVVRVPLLPLAFLLGVLPAVRMTRWYGQQLPTRWKWVVAHVVASFVAVAAAAIGWWSLPPLVFWVTAPVSSCLILSLALREPFVALVILTAYGAAFAASLALLGIGAKRRREGRGFDVLVEAHALNDRDTPR